MSVSPTDVAHAVGAFRAENSQAGPRPLDERIGALVRHFAEVLTWGVHNDVSWRQKIPAAIAQMSFMASDDPGAIDATLQVLHGA